ncbi:MAG TPA: ABC transporter substrate-binding protein [Thermoclostridium sp.]|nr:ABC transporter substrate-binding protein [Clostridiaceae bacterium]HOQ75503.1 ABC transporter substrate-binding protein [Thermoclostridium sp.]HPU45238.1 ABC transporter substrate-binding protein [Thermoclostridium sp.]
MRTTKKNKRLLSILSVILVLGLLLTACSSQPSPAGSQATQDPSPSASGQQASGQDSDIVLRIGWGGSLCEAPLHMAVEKGFFDEEGLKYELIKLAPGTAFDAITANQIDACFGLLASLVQPLSNGLPIKITTGLHTGCDKVLVKPDSGINGPKDFIGKKVGVPSFTSSPYIYAKRVLADNGVDVTVKNSQVEFVVYATPDLPMALEKGAVDAIAMNDPTATIAARENNFIVIFDSAIDEPYKDQYCCSAYVRENIAREHPEIAAKYTRAMQKASAWVQENKDETARIQVENKWVAGDEQVNAEVLKTFYYIPSYIQAYEMFGLLSDQLQNVGMLEADVDTKALQQNSFVKLDNLPYE